MCSHRRERITCDMDKIMQTATEIREFNRFYLPYFHLLTQKYLNMDCSVAEARILYEIYDEHEISATDIVNVLHVDKGYLSRILKKFEAKSIIAKKASKADSRRTLITLTEKGKALAENLIAESNMQIAKELASLSADDMDKLVYHMKNIVNILGGMQNGTD